MTTMADELKPVPLDYRGPAPGKRKLSLDPESRRWRRWRILFRIGLFLILGPVIIHFGTNYIMFGKSSRLAPADFASTVLTNDVSTVRAMKEYQRDTGHLPNQVDDLVPKYLAARPSGMQDIQSGRFLNFANFNHMITYDFTPGNEGWSVTGPFANGRIPLPPVTLPPGSQSSYVPK
jgi:hypothetical protein